ncbi:SLC39A14 [Mytilus coruscus]|uniref:SLC39A14 n=1 Tax=Mytilus coruscus TaxID=42192 RepID=A0A6J8DM30_MYTCO|nr:SLC39A14 [Mytilus coruscus]
MFRNKAQDLYFQLDFSVHLNFEIDSRMEYSNMFHFIIVEGIQESWVKSQEITITEGFEKLRQKKYNPKTRPTVELADYYEVGDDNLIRDGYCILAPGAKIAVNEIWLYGVLSTISKKRDRKAPKAKEKAGFEILKRLIDGFYEPWDLAIDGGTKVFHDSKIFRALRSYAEHKLEMDQITFNRGWLEKMSSAKKTVKRLNKLASESENQTRVALEAIYFKVNYYKIQESQDHDNYLKSLINKFSSDSSLSQHQFQELAIDLTANKLPGNYSLHCDNQSPGTSCNRNQSTQCLGYDDVFNLYAKNGKMNETALVKAVPALLYYTQEKICMQPDTVIYHKHHKKPSSSQAWGYGIGFVSSIVLISNIGAFLGPCMKTQLFKRILMFCVALAVGTLAATGLLVLTPEALGLTGIDSPIPDYNWKMTTVLGGIYFVFICERLLKMILKGRKRKGEEEEVKLNIQDELKNGTDFEHSHVDPEDIDNSSGGVATVAWILLLGDSIHNFVDGLSIGAAFTENVFTGVSVSLAVICEELPHELGDIAILLHSGLTMKKALFYNFLAAVVCYVGLIVGIVVGENTDANRWIFAFAGGLFIYIALVDMIPEMNEQAATSRKNQSESTFQIFLYQNTGLLLGVKSHLFEVARMHKKLNRTNWIFSNCNQIPLKTRYFQKLTRGQY